MSRLMNIVSLEGQIAGMVKMKPKVSTTQNTDLTIWKKERELVGLTGNERPADLLEQMFALSKH